MVMYGHFCCNDHEPVDGMDIWFLEYCDVRQKNLRGEDALWCSSKVLTCEWSIPGYLDTCCITQLLIIIWPSIEWRCHRSRFTEGDIVILLLLHVIVVCLMCVPCGNSLKILGNLYVRGSASWGVIEEDLSGASSARVRFSVSIVAAHVRFFEASYVRRSDVFSCKTLNLGKPSGQVHWYHLVTQWPFAMPWPGHCCQWFDRTGCLHSRLPPERCEACLSASQTMTNLWHCDRIPKGRKKHENIILTWCSLPFPATSVFFTKNYCTGLMLT